MKTLYITLLIALMVLAYTVLNCTSAKAELLIASKQKIEEMFENRKMDSVGDISEYLAQHENALRTEAKEIANSLGGEDQQKLYKELTSFKPEMIQSPRFTYVIQTWKSIMEPLSPEYQEPVKEESQENKDTESNEKAAATE